MKTAVEYISKNGTTEATVNRMKKLSNTNVDYYDLQNATKIDIAAYDQIFIGFGIYASTLPKPMRTFLESKELEKVKTVFFIHALASRDNYRFIIESPVRNNSWTKNVKVHYLGGACDLKKQNFLVKGVLKMIAKKKNLDPNHMVNLDETAIKDFLTEFKNEI